MALNHAYISFINDCNNRTIGDFSGKTMLELGDQIIRKGEIPETTGKEYYSNRGVNHISIDLNGNNGSLELDLSKIIDKKEWFNYFDIITNSGTTEHIEPKQAQYITFMNIHNCMKVGGIAVHLVPDINELEINGKWKGHCNNYYSFNFFYMLSQKNAYEIISFKIINGLICVGLQKTRDNTFMKDQHFFLKYINRKRGGVVYPGINDSKFKRFFRKFYKIQKRF